VNRPIFMEPTATPAQRCAALRQGVGLRSTAGESGSHLPALKKFFAAPKLRWSGKQRHAPSEGADRTTLTSPAPTLKSTDEMRVEASSRGSKAASPIGGLCKPTDWRQIIASASDACSLTYWRICRNR
jgi:hypothetical protein